MLLFRHKCWTASRGCDLTKDVNVGCNNLIPQLTHVVVFWRQQSVLLSHSLISPPLLFSSPPFFSRMYLRCVTYLMIVPRAASSSPPVHECRSIQEERCTTGNLNFQSSFFCLLRHFYTCIFENPGVIMFFPPVSFNVRELLMSLTADSVVMKLRQLWQKQTVKNNTLKKHFWECEWIINTVPRWHWARHFNHMQLTPQGRFRITFKPDSSSSDKSLTL